MKNKKDYSRDFQKRIIFVHLLNDYSGSPKVLSQILHIVSKELHTELYTSKGTGFLTNSTAERTHYFSYTWNRNKIWTFLLYFKTQLSLFFQLIRSRKSYSTVYINTVLPFGAALAGKLLRKTVIYHIHESYIKPPIFKNFLRFIIAKTASRIIFVSESLKRSEGFQGITQSVIYNSLEEKFVKQAKDFLAAPKRVSEFTVLMVCSLKAYKGVEEFIEIAKICEGNNITFTLVLNANKEEIQHYFKAIQLPTNIQVRDKQSNVHPFYQKASLVLNLSRPSECIETFGLTIIEALAYGLPVIVPPVGGPAEIVRPGIEGYLISSNNIIRIARQIMELSEDPLTHSRLSTNARYRAAAFNEKRFSQQILEIL